MSTNRASMPRTKDTMSSGRRNLPWLEPFEEYLKGWFALEILRNALQLLKSPDRGFVFNMSVGYTLEGIQSKTMDAFINSLKDAASHPLFEEYKSTIKRHAGAGTFNHLAAKSGVSGWIDEALEKISPSVSSSVTLSQCTAVLPLKSKAWQNI